MTDFHREIAAEPRRCGCCDRYVTECDADPCADAKACDGPTPRLTPDGVARWEVRVMDADGMWGSVRVQATNRLEAGDLAVEHVKALAEAGETAIDMDTIKTVVVGQVS